jgi:hypothetical protein
VDQPNLGVDRSHLVWPCRSRSTASGSRRFAARATQRLQTPRSAHHVESVPSRRSVHWPARIATYPQARPSRTAVCIPSPRGASTCQTWPTKHYRTTCYARDCGCASDLRDRADRRIFRAAYRGPVRQPTEPQRLQPNVRGTLRLRTVGRGARTPWARGCSPCKRAPSRTPTARARPQTRPRMPVSFDRSTTAQRQRPLNVPAYHHHGHAVSVPVPRPALGRAGTSPSDRRTAPETTCPRRTSPS